MSRSSAEIKNSTTSIAHAASTENDIVKCVCGTELQFIDAKSIFAYGGDAGTVSCDICGQQCKQHVFHCPKNKSKQHKFGFDICVDCVQTEVQYQYTIRWQ